MNKPTEILNYFFVQMQIPGTPQPWSTLREKLIFFAILFWILVLSLWIHIALHEIGHTIAQILPSSPPKVVCIGRLDARGRSSSFKLGQIEFRLFPCIQGGFASDSEKLTELQPTPLRQIAAALGGLGATAGATVAAAFLARSLPADLWLKPCLAIFAVSGSAMFACDLALPSRYGSDGERLILAIGSILRKTKWPAEFVPAGRKRIVSLIKAAVAATAAIAAFLWTARNLAS